jgi:Flp pilus assembly protein TadG
MMLGYIRSLRRRLVRDERGVSAVEFALVLPILIMIYLAGIELSHAITVDRKLTVAGGSVGDLVAQGVTINTTEINNIFSAADAIMAPYATSELKVVVSSVEIKENGDEVLASCSHHTSPRTVGSAIEIPEGVRIEGTTLIVTEVNYKYVPKLGQLLSDAIYLSDRFFMRPRQVDKVNMTC